MTQYRCRKGTYLPTVPELTHMPLCWWYSRSLKPDKDARGIKRWLRRPPRLSKSTYNRGRRTGPILCHILLLLLPLTASLSQRLTQLNKYRVAAADVIKCCFGLKRTIFKTNSKHNWFKDWPDLSHPLVCCFPLLISSRTRLHDCASRHKTSNSFCAAFKCCQKKWNC